MHPCVLALFALHAASASPTLHYTLTPTAGTLHVELRAKGIPPNTKPVLPTHWGNATDLGHAIRNLQHHSSSHLSYDLIQDWQGDLRESVRHRPHLTNTYLEIGTQNGLIYPELPPDGRIIITFDWRLPPGWSLATSFGARANARRYKQRFQGPLHQFVNAWFTAGDFRLARHKVQGGEVVTAIRGQFAFDDTAFHHAILKLIRYERAFFEDHRFPYFLVTLAPFGKGQSGSGGGGFTNAFNLHTAPESKLTTGLLSLIAHETFHTWNPLRMGRIASPQSQSAWFSEGFTRYYQDILLLEAGLMQPQEYLDALNTRIREYHLQRHNPDDQLPRLGFLFALWLDAQHPLDPLLRHLVKDRNPVFDKPRILAAIAHYYGTATAETVARHLDSNQPVTMPTKTRIPCAAPHPVEMHAFDLGMDRAALIESRRVTNLNPNGNAARAGLREGDAIRGISIYWNDTDKPVKLTTRDGRTFTYLPHGESLGTVPQYRCP
ncbi:MAG: hypothetical protein JNK87_05740 [Bryobacterales bacterium]|nr:hypothetical protein [Bryobacterales bacterium]